LKDFVGRVRSFVGDNSKKLSKGEVNISLKNIVRRTEIKVKVAQLKRLQAQDITSLHVANARDERGTKSRKPMLKRVLLCVSSAIPCFYVVAVLFGAPFFSHFAATFTFAIVLSLICVFPIAVVVRTYDDLDSVIFDNNPSTGSQLIAHRIALGGLLGAWLGAFVIPLDWDRWWQVGAIYQLYLDALLEMD
uniref:Heme O synthase n=1 Tax=Ascaris lumbricoides TaxID=6252 RepID=A0A0M3IUG2_ASCLU